MSKYWCQTGTIICQGHYVTIQPMFAGTWRCELVSYKPVQWGSSHPKRPPHSLCMFVPVSYSKSCREFGNFDQLESTPRSFCIWKQHSFYTWNGILKKINLFQQRPTFLLKLSDRPHISWVSLVTQRYRTRTVSWWFLLCCLQCACKVTAITDWIRACISPRDGLKLDCRNILGTN